MKKIINFIIESYAELKKVSWPTRDDVVAQTMVVIVSLVIVSALLFLFDIFSINLIKWIVTIGKPI